MICMQLINKLNLKIWQIKRLYRCTAHHISNSRQTPENTYLISQDAKPLIFSILRSFGTIDVGEPTQDYVLGGQSHPVGVFHKVRRDPRRYLANPIYILSTYKRHRERNWWQYVNSSSSSKAFRLTKKIIIYSEFLSILGLFVRSETLLMRRVYAVYGSVYAVDERKRFLV